MYVRRGEEFEEPAGGGNEEIWRALEKCAQILRGSRGTAEEELGDYSARR